MKEFADINEKDFKALLTEGGNLRSMQILQGALSAGVGAFGIVVVVLHVLGMGPADQMPARENSLLPILTLVHAAVALGSWSMAFLLFPRLLRQGGGARRRSRTGLPEDPAGRLLGNLRGATILRLAILEGAALLGLVVCLLGVLQGNISEQPIYWLNSLSAFAFLVYTGMTFPTEDQVLDIFREMKREARHGG